MLHPHGLHPRPHRRRLLAAALRTPTIRHHRTGSQLRPPDAVCPSTRQTARPHRRYAQPVDGPLVLRLWRRALQICEGAGRLVELCLNNIPTFRQGETAHARFPACGWWLGALAHGHRTPELDAGRGWEGLVAGLGVCGRVPAGV